MRQIFSFFITLGLFTGTSLAFADASPGFLKSNDTKIPKAVKESAKSVYQILALTDTELPFRSYNLEDTKTYVDSKCTPKEIHNLLGEKNCNAMKKCLAAGGLKSSEYSWTKGLLKKGTDEQMCFEPYHGAGTAFVYRRQDKAVELLTNWHVIVGSNKFAVSFLQPAILRFEPQKRKELLSNLKSSFELYSMEGNFVLKVSGSKTSFSALGDAIGPYASQNEGVQAVGLVLEDFALIRFEDENKLGPALKVRSTPVKVGTKGFALGYPDKTEGRTKNSDGKGLRFSPGEFLSQKAFLELFEKNGAETNSKLQQAASEVSKIRDKKSGNYSLPKDRALSFFGGDLVSGNSGGPVVDESGNVIMLTVKSLSSLKKYSPSGSIGIYFPHLDKLFKSKKTN